MKAFHTIAIPHRDILEGKLTMDVFAADLWEVYQRRGSDEYKDTETFFTKTYMTEGLKNLLAIVEKRLSGHGGDPVIQIQTPFGGGKTHALIAMYHKSSQWNARKVVVVGNALSMDETLWSVIEKQLTGKTVRFTSQIAPGKEAIRDLLNENQPVLILMDEVLEYVTRAAGIKVVESTLAAQTIAFVQELTEAASALDKVCLVITLPSSIMEHYGEGAEKLYQQLQKVAGRVEKIYTPVQENEITKIIRRRLFSDLAEDDARKVVVNFIKYAEKEGILQVGTQPSQYRDRFLDSYPFMPEVVDILYHRWGSFPTFQRTRGVLRLLSLVIYSLRSKSRPYISLADFNLADQEIRQELLKHIGAEFNGVIANDITDFDAGSQKVDLSLGSSYQGLNLGSRAATSIFLHSFSGGHERGATLGEIKRSASTTENPASVIAEATEQLKGKLFYLQNIGDRYFFTNQPNLNRILLTNMENVREEQVVEAERELLRSSISGGKLKVFIWEEKSANIPDSEELKLVILNRENKQIISDMLKNKGQTPRVYCNTLFFVYPLESEKPVFIDTIKRKLAYEYIEADKTLNLSDEQRKEVRKELKQAESDIKESIRRLYRLLSIPTREGTKETDLGIPTYGEQKGLDQEVYEKLRTEGEILERIAPLLLKEKYLRDKEWVPTDQLYQSSLKTPGEPRPISKLALEQGLAEGVRMGMFGLGELEDDKPVCRYFRREPSVAFSGSEVIISETLCREHEEEEEASKAGREPYPPISTTPPLVPTGKIEDTLAPPKHVRDVIHVKFQVPKGKVSSVMGVMNLLQSKFDNLEIELIADGGEISEQDYEDKIKEAFRQLGIEIHDS